MLMQEDFGLFFFVHIHSNLEGQCIAHYGFKRELLSTAKPEPIAAVSFRDISIGGVSLPKRLC